MLAEVKVHDPTAMPVPERSLQLVAQTHPWRCVRPVGGMEALPTWVRPRMVYAVQTGALSGTPVSPRERATALDEVNSVGHQQRSVRGHSFD